MARWKVLCIVMVALLAMGWASGVQISDEEDEFMLDSEIHRRLLASRPYYISYGALSADRVPCPPMSGNSYYNPRCSRGGPANPYKRGCSVITRCRRDVS